MEDRQTSKLTEMLEYVSEHNGFYKQIIHDYHITDPNDITQYPILTRKKLQENRYNMFSDGYKAKYFNQQLRRQSSSGSTGVPVNVYWDYKDWYASNLALWRKRWEWYGIKPSNKRVMFTLNAFGEEYTSSVPQHIVESENLLIFNISMAHSISDYEKMVDIICDFKPQWLYIQPHILSNLVNVMQQHKSTIQNSLMYIESVGETLSTSLRDQASELFDVPVVNMYGSEEMNGIAYESPEHDMRILNDNVLVEVLCDDGIIRDNGTGKAIITSLNNVGMPLIRYAQGDNITISRKPTTKTSETVSILNAILGREIGSITLQSGCKISSYTLSEVVSEVNNEFSDIIMDYYYVYKNKENELVCHIKLEPERSLWKNSVINALNVTMFRKLQFLSAVGFSVVVDDPKYLTAYKSNILVEE